MIKYFQQLAVSSKCFRKSKVTTTLVGKNFNLIPGRPRPSWMLKAGSTIKQTNSASYTCISSQAPAVATYF